MVLKIFGKIERTHLAAALLVLLGSFIVYLKTMAPTLSFWDCGEFIAVSAILGIPHPPGSPLYVLIGRIFSLLPLFDDISARVNLLSAVSSSFTALFCYLCGVRILRHWFTNELNWFSRLLIYGGSASGAFMAAFGITNWNNAVEAEVYGLAMMLTTAIVWLTLVYLDNKDDSRGKRIMLLVIYLSFLGISVHMTTFLALPIVALAYILKRNAPPYIWLMLAGYVLFELYLIFALSSKPDEVPYYIPVLIVAILYMFFIFSFEQIRAFYLVVAVGFALSVAPLYAAVYSAATIATGEGQAVGVSTVSFLNNVGGVSFIALILFSLFSLTKYFKLKRQNKIVPHYLQASVFVLAAALMSAVIMIDGLKGYKPFLFLSVILTGILALLVYRQINWSILIACGGIFMVVVGVMPFFYGVLISIVALILGGLVFRLTSWKTAVMMILVAVVGFSSHLFIPIRSANRPAINENNPSKSLQATINYLERKQYGSQSMIDRMFVRRGEWLNQFGNFRRMGFWLAFSEQYGLKESAFVFPLLIGVFGLWEVIRRGPRKGVLLLLLLLIASAGLVLYMNFADGTRQHPVSGADYLEVRERDYFFTPAFILFGLCIGLGAAAIVQYVRESLKNLSAAVRAPIVVVSSLLLLFPVITVAKNYHYADRTGNYVAFDYGWDLLQSADENAIFFTNGDNDTFPLWCLQQAYGIRPDVKLVNLSLANTDWYIKQLNPDLGLNFSLSDAKIEALRPFRTSDGTVVRIHHQVIDKLVDENFGKTPINFSVTVGADNRRYRGQSLDSMLSLMGYNWRLYGTPKNFGVEVEEGYDFFMNPDKFKCRSANDPDVYLDETSERLTRNLANGFMVLADTLRKAKDNDRAEKLLLRARELMPRATEPLQLLARIYSEENKTEQLRIMIDTCQFQNKEVLLFFLAHGYRQAGDNLQAEAAFDAALQLNPSYRPAFDDLMKLHLEMRNYSKLRVGLMKWLQFNPQDQQIRELYKEMEKVVTGDTGGGAKQ